MSDLIDRQDAIDAFDCTNELIVCGEANAQNVVNYINKVVGKIKDLPSAQPETAKRIVGRSRDGMTLWYQCDMCNEPVDVQDNYCRGCGRRLTDG